MKKDTNDVLGLSTDTENLPTNTPATEHLEGFFKREVSGFFEIISAHDKHFIALGNHRLTEFKKSPEECERMIIDKDWELLAGFIGALISIDKMSVPDISNDERTK